MSPHRPSQLSGPIRGCWKSLEPLLALSAHAPLLSGTPRPLGTPSLWSRPYPS